MHVSFCRQSFGGRRELDFVGAFDHDAIAGLQTVLDGDEVAVARRDLDVTSREPFAADLEEHVGPASFEQNGSLEHCWCAYAVGLEQHRCAGLPDEQLASRVLDFELNRQGARLRIDDARVVHVVWLEDERLRTSGVEAGLTLATFAGTFGRTYDLRTVIEAAKILRANRSERVHFVLCGAGERDAEWRALAAGQDVTFTGWLPAAELAYLLSKSSIGLAAYSANAPQGIPNKVIEYLSASLPVLCSLPGECRNLLSSARCGAPWPRALQLW